MTNATLAMERLMTAEIVVTEGLLILVALVLLIVFLVRKI